MKFVAFALLIFVSSVSFSNADGVLSASKAKAIASDYSDRVTNILKIVEAANKLDHAERLSTFRMLPELFPTKTTIWDNVQSAEFAANKEIGKVESELAAFHDCRATVNYLEEYIQSVIREEDPEIAQYAGAIAYRNTIYSSTYCALKTEETILSIGLRTSEQQMHFLLSLLKNAETELLELTGPKISNSAYIRAPVGWRLNVSVSAPVAELAAVSNVVFGRDSKPYHQFQHCLSLIWLFRDLIDDLNSKNIASEQLALDPNIFEKYKSNKTACMNELANTEKNRL
jgi:hypothetical protein